MRRHVELSEAAKLDVAEAAVWYAEQRLGLEEEFLTAVNDVLTRIAENAEVFSFIHRDLRHALLRRFPYLVVYEIAGDIASIIAIVHASRDPDEWRRRI